MLSLSDTHPQHDVTTKKVEPRPPFVDHYLSTHLDDLDFEPNDEEALVLAEHLSPPVDSTLKLYAIMDAAIVKELLVEKLEQVPETTSIPLVPGDAHYSLRNVSPWLIDLNDNAELLMWLITEGWGRNWGIYIHASVGYSELYYHLFTLTSVKGLEDDNFYFRYHDPRITRAFLASLTATETNLFFGPIESLLVEQDFPIHLRAYSRPEALEPPEPAPEPSNWYELPTPWWSLSQKQWDAIVEQREQAFLDYFYLFLLDANIIEDFSNKRLREALEIGQAFGCTTERQLALFMSIFLLCEKRFQEDKLLIKKLIKSAADDEEDRTDKLMMLFDKYKPGVE